MILLSNFNSIGNINYIKSSNLFFLKIKTLNLCSILITILISCSVKKYTNSLIWISYRKTHVSYEDGPYSYNKSPCIS